MPKREKGVRPHKKKCGNIIIASDFFFVSFVGVLATKRKKSYTIFNAFLFIFK